MIHTNFAQVNIRSINQAASVLAPGATCGNPSTWLPREMYEDDGIEGDSPARRACDQCRLRKVASYSGTLGVPHAPTPPARTVPYLPCPANTAPDPLRQGLAVC
ncbi:hypothetical protein BT67DRAFT_442949, partial [Trichocladium antarcticum]